MAYEKEKKEILEALAASIMSWAAVSLLGMLVCGIISRRWNRYYQEI